MKKVGFWYSESEPELPMPEEHGTQAWEHRANFMGILTMLQMSMINDWRASNFQNGHSRYQEQYPDAAVHQYRGWSMCRLCKQTNGTKEFVLGGFTWPEGYAHYLDYHNVAPDPDFKQFILNWAAESVKIDGKPLILE